MLTVHSLLEDCGLTLAAGDSAADRGVRWVSISEHEDPTPWLSGGEVVMTTGLQLDAPKRQREYVSRLAKHGVAALGFGTGFDHAELPEAILESAREHGMPLFEVPYEMPFIAITERAATRLVSEQYDALARGSKVQEQLERLVIDGGGLAEITASIAGFVAGAALVFDAQGQQVARHPATGVPRPAETERIVKELDGRLGSGGAATSFEPEALPKSSLAVPVPGRRGAPPAGWLVVCAERGELSDFERLIARQASIVVGLELMRERVVNETERRLAGDLLADALSGRLEPGELEGRLRPFGIAADASVMVFELDDPAAAEPVLEQHLARTGIPSLVATTAATGRPLLCAVVSGGGADDGVRIAAQARLALLPAHPAVRASASRSVPVGSLRRAFHEARCALEATSFQNGGGPDVASHRDLGAFTLLLALQDDDALRLYADGLLEPISRDEGEYGGELLRSLEAFIENNGNWERAARELFCHRHTLRYRIRKIEELTGRDLGRATDRIELWLALRARELVR